MKEQTKNFVTTPRSQIKCENSFPCLHIALFCSFSTSIEVFTLEREREKKFALIVFLPKRCDCKILYRFKYLRDFYKQG